MEQGWAAAKEKGEALCKTPCCKGKVVEVVFICTSRIIYADTTRTTEHSPEKRYHTAHGLAGREGKPNIGGSLPLCGQRHPINCGK